MSERYAGIGSRRTPPEVCAEMTAIAQRLSAAGYTLRSGGAAGADLAFEAGAGDRKEILLTRPGLRVDGWEQGAPRYPDGRTSFVLTPEQASAARPLAARVHPNWDAVLRAGSSGFALAAHTRNVTQILGANLDTPVAFVVFWAPQRGLQVEGGTATAVAIARGARIPVYNLGIERERSAFADRLRTIESSQSRSHPPDGDGLRQRAAGTVLGEMASSTLTVRVANVRDEKEGEYVGRAMRDRAGSPLGNPFRLVSEDERGATIERYRDWLRERVRENDPAVMNELARLLGEAREPGGVTLLCFCAPKACHADVVASAIIGLERKRIEREAGQERETVPRSAGRSR
jgi:hypothetical protein